MFKVRSIVLVVVLGLLTTLAGIVGFNKVEDEILERERQRVAGSRSALQRAQERRQARQYLLATFIANSEVACSLAVLERFRDDLIAAQNQAYGAHPGMEQEAIRAREEFIKNFSKDGKTLPELFVSALAREVEGKVGVEAFGRGGKQTFLQEETERFIKCAAIGIDQCMWEFTYNTFVKVRPRLEALYGGPIESRVFIMDKRGIGLADSANPRWSKQEGFAQNARLPLEAARTGKAKYGLAFVENRYFLATAMALQQDGKVVGFVMVGDSIDERMAREDSDAVSADIIYAYGSGGTKKAIASPLPQNVTTDLLTEPLEVETRVAVTIRVDSEIGDDGLEAVVSRDVSYLTAAFSSARNTLLLIGLFFTVAAAGIFVWLLRSFYSAFETLDQGVHEVINGNLDYVFPFEFKEDIARSLGQSLNLMSLVLQGRPLPEDLEEKAIASASWLSEENIFLPEERGPDWGETKPTVQMDIKTLTALAEEPADVYYKRIYSEFLEARKRLGLSNEGVNYPKFVERLVRLEQGLKKKYRTRVVRFIVKTVDGNVVLEPVPIPSRTPQRT